MQTNQERNVRTFTVSLHPATVKQLDAEARRLVTSRSVLVRQAVDRFLRENAPKQTEAVES